LAGSSGKYFMPACPASVSQSGGLQKRPDARARERGTEK